MLRDEFISAYWKFQRKIVSAQFFKQLLVQYDSTACAYLEIRHSSCCDDPKHNYEHPTHHGWRDGGEYGAHFTKHTHGNHQYPTDYDHHATANLQKDKRQNEDSKVSLFMSHNYPKMCLWGSSTQTLNYMCSLTLPLLCLERQRSRCMMWYHFLCPMLQPADSPTPLCQCLCW